MDYADINEVAEDEDQKEKHYQLGMKYVDSSNVSTGMYICVCIEIFTLCD